ncbi:hypothetical protein KY334_03965 [Candidatus Woesearchaeota archaeon]|nr:hypothetical protein [Candidatus Woesearchaeota archaeon]
MVSWTFKAHFKEDKMQKEYIIEEHEIGLKYVDGKLESELKPGKYKFGVHEKDIKERIYKANKKKDDFLVESFYDLEDKSPEVTKRIRDYEEQLKRLRKKSIFSFLKIYDDEEIRELRKQIEKKIRYEKINHYFLNLEVPEKIREKIIEFDKEIEEARKEPLIEIKKIDKRQLTLTVTGQEMITNDKVTIRLNVIAQYNIKDAKKAANSVVSYENRLYQQIQMVVRDYASANTLDQLLTNKNVIGKYILKEVKDLATSIGLELIEVGLKDIILPGEIREAMNKVVEAERQGKATFIKAREEVAAARALANAAKIISSDENILKLKQMEALKEIANSPSTTIYFGIGDDLIRAIKNK